MVAKAVGRNIVPAGPVCKLMSGAAGFLHLSLAGLLRKLPNLNRHERILCKLPARDA